jgi:3,4-dihydroxy-2-butanone 4-phosphate synthase
MPFATVEAALAAIRAGGMVIVVDDEDRENEGDLTLAAERVTPAAVNFMATHGKGLICVPLPAARCEALHLPPMVAENTAPLGTAFCVSVEARRGVGTGISAADLPHIFERFYRGGNNRPAGIEGTGLGLAICKKIVEKHNGAIVARSQPGQGTTFVISF